MKKPILLYLLIFSVYSLYAAETPQIDEEVPPAPVVSGLTASILDDAVSLSWNSAPDIEGSSRILRSDRPITAANYKLAEQIAELPYTVTEYTDTPPEKGDFFYAVLSIDESGNEYAFFLPASNALIVSVTAGPVVQAEPVAVHSFDTVTRNDAVIATWSSSRSEKTLLVYRSTYPFTDINSLVSAIVVATIPDDGSPYVDYPVPGVPYYYAVSDEDAVRAGTVRFEPGTNTNRIPVEVSSRFSKIQRGAVPPLRSMPLPWLNPHNDMPVTSHTFSKNTELKIQAILSKSGDTASVERIPYVFTMDLQTDTGGEELTLRTIVKDYFMPGEWDTAIRELRKFLSIRRSSTTAARARFYIGEALFFSGNYSDALLEFLLAQDTYYNQSREWIQYTLDTLSEIN